MKPNMPYTAELIIDTKCRKIVLMGHIAIIVKWAVCLSTGFSELEAMVKSETVKV